MADEQQQQRRDLGNGRNVQCYHASHLHAFRIFSWLICKSSLPAVDTGQWTAFAFSKSPAIVLLDILRQNTVYDVMYARVLITVPDFQSEHNLEVTEFRLIAT